MVSQLRKVVWVRVGGFLQSQPGCEGGRHSLFSPHLGGELLCSPGHPWRAAEVNCAASGDAGLGGKPRSLAGSVYSRVTLEKNSSTWHVQCCHKAVKASLHHSSWGCALRGQEGKMRAVFTAGCQGSQSPHTGTNIQQNTLGFETLLNKWQVMAGQADCYRLSWQRPLHHL